MINFMNFKYFKNLLKKIGINKFNLNYLKKLLTKLLKNNIIIRKG